MGRRPKKKIRGLKLDLTWIKEFRLLRINFTTGMSNMVELNYNPKIQSMLSLFQEYQKRKLTLICKIRVLKSLAIPKLVHAMAVLPSPGTQILNKFQKIIREFIWDGEKAKIGLGQLSLPHEKGGLLCTYINKFSEWLHLSWISRIIN